MEKGEKKPLKNQIWCVNPCEKPVLPSWHLKTCPHIELIFEELPSWRERVWAGWRGKRARGKQQGTLLFKYRGICDVLFIQLYDHLLSLGLKIPLPRQIHHCCSWLSSPYTCNTVAASLVDVLLGPLVGHSWKLAESKCSLGNSHVSEHSMSIYCSCRPSATLRVSCRRTCISQKDGKSSTNCSQWSWCLRCLISPGESWGGGTAREKLSQEKLVRIDYLITNKHSACFFIIFMPTILTHIQCGEIAA